MSESKNNKRFNPVGLNVTPRLIAKSKKDKKKSSLLNSTFVISTVSVMLIFFVLLLPNMFSQTVVTPDLVAYNNDSSTVIADGTISPGEYAAKFSSDSGFITLYTEHNATYLFIGIECQGEGWCAVGFNEATVEGNPMTGADIKLGWVEDTSGAANAEDRHGVAPITPKLDSGSTNTIVAFNGSQSSGITTMEFIISLDQGDTTGGDDIILSAGSSYKLLFAMGKNDDFDIHIFKDSILFEISSSNTP